MFDYPVNLKPAEEGGYIVTFPDVPEAITQGEDRDEALFAARDALETALSFYLDEQKDLPKPGRPGKRPTVSPSALACAKLAVYQAMRERGVGRAELARRLGWHLQQIARVLDLDHASRLDQIEAALAALGKRLEVAVREAA